MCRSFYQDDKCVIRASNLESQCFVQGICDNNGSIWSFKEDFCIPSSLDFNNNVENNYTSRLFAQTLYSANQGIQSLCTDESLHSESLFAGDSDLCMTQVLAYDNNIDRFVVGSRRVSCEDMNNRYVNEGYPSGQSCMGDQNRVSFTSGGCFGPFENWPNDFNADNDTIAFMVVYDCLGPVYYCKSLAELVSSAHHSSSYEPSQNPTKQPSVAPIFESAPSDAPILSSYQPPSNSDETIAPSLVGSNNGNNDGTANPTKIQTQQPSDPLFGSPGTLTPSAAPTSGNAAMLMTMRRIWACVVTTMICTEIIVATLT